MPKRRSRMTDAGGQTEPDEAEELADEAVAVGFELVRLAATDFGRIVIVQRPI